MPTKRKAHNSTLSAPAKPMPRVNKARQQRREEAGLTYGPVHDYVKSLTCDVRGRQRSDGTIHVCGFYEDRPNVESHHIKHVGSGGEDRNNTLPLCPKAHDEAHALPVGDWCRLYHRDFRSVACDYSQQFDQENG